MRLDNHRRPFYTQEQLFEVRFLRKEIKTSYHVAQSALARGLELFFLQGLESGQNILPCLTEFNLGGANLRSIDSILAMAESRTWIIP
jgi:hypothetical protein